MPKPPLRTFMIVFAAVAAIVIPIWQFSSGWGMSAAAFSAQGDSTLRVAGYAFSIWSLLYFGMAAYALYQALPSTKGGALLNVFGWPSVVAMLGCGLWILASAANAQWLTIAIIVTSAAFLIVATLTAPSPQGGREFWFIFAPMTALAGWLTIASAVNILTVLTAQDFISFDLARVWALAGVGAVTLLGLLLAGRAPFYPLPMAWGLAGAVAAELNANPVLAYVCAGASALLVVASLVSFARRRRAVARTAPAEMSSSARGWR